MSSNLRNGINSDGKVLHISEVPNGLKCNCVCPVCETNLIARKGQKNEHHFSHSNSMNCVTAPETALHKLAKEIVVEANEIQIDEFKTFEYKMACPETKVGEIIPDIILSNGSEIIYVEIAVTNPISFEKEVLLRQSNRRTLEIDLSDVKRDIFKKELTKLVLFDTERRRLIEKLPQINPTEHLSNSFNWMPLIGVGIFAWIVWTFGRSKSNKRNCHQPRQYKKKKYGR